MHVIRVFGVQHVQDVGADLFVRVQQQTHTNKPSRGSGRAMQCDKFVRCVCVSVCVCVCVCVCRSDGRGGDVGISSFGPGTFPVRDGVVERAVSV